MNAHDRFLTTALRRWCPRAALLSGLWFAAMATTAAMAASNALGIAPETTALVFTDPQNEALSEQGKAWPLVKDAVLKNHTIEHMEQLFQAARQGGYPVFISPHYYYPTDNGWLHRDPLGQVMHDNHMFERKSMTSDVGLAGSGADWLDRFKPYINDGRTVVSAPHKLYGPQTNDLVLQLRKRGIQKVVLGGMLANMCVEAHARELLEQGFEVIIVKDAVAAPNHPEWGDGNVSAAINYRYLAKLVPSADEVVKAMGAK